MLLENILPPIYGQKETCLSQVLCCVPNVESCQVESNPAASKEYKQNEYKKLKQDNVDCIDAGAGVSEPGLNRRPDNMIA